MVGGGGGGHVAVVGEGFADEGAGGVAGHDDEGVAEVDGAALAIGEAAGVEDLEEDVVDGGVGLFDFVEEDDGVGAAADGLGELAALVVADVAGRGADEAGDGVLVEVLGHVEADHGVLVVEEEFGEGAGEFGLADAGGAEKEEGADGAVGVLEAGAGAADGLGDGGEGVVLADDALAEVVLEVEEAGLLGLLKAVDGDAGAAGDDGGDLVGGDLLLEEALGVGDGGEVLLGVLELAGGGGEEGVLDFGGGGEVAGVFGGLLADAEGVAFGGGLADLGEEDLFVVPAGLELGELGGEGVLFGGEDLEALAGGFVGLLAEGDGLHLELHDLAVEGVDLDGLGLGFDLEAGEGLVDEVDGLVGEEAVGDVA